MGLISKEVIENADDGCRDQSVVVCPVETSGSPSQMTIFYAGSVNVYNDISPQKAQALMVLAQDGSSISSRGGAHSKTEAPRALAAEDGVPVKQTITTSASAAILRAREASLAQFLRKRKERVINSAPYKLSKKSE